MWGNEWDGNTLNSICQDIDLIMGQYKYFFVGEEVSEVVPLHHIDLTWWSEVTSCWVECSKFSVVLLSYPAYVLQYFCLVIIKKPSPNSLEVEHQSCKLEVLSSILSLGFPFFLFYPYHTIPHGTISSEESSDVPITVVQCSVHRSKETCHITHHILCHFCTPHALVLCDATFKYIYSANEWYLSVYVS